MDVRDILRATRRHWWLVAAVLAAALAVAGLATKLAAPQYATSMTFFVTAPGEAVSDSYQGALLSQQRVASYAHLFGGELARRVADAPGVDLTPEQVRSRVASRAVPRTSLLEVVVTDGDRARSELIAGVVVGEFISWVQRLETPLDGGTSKVKVDVVSGPSLDPVPVSPKPVRNFALALIFGLLLGVVAATLRQLFDSTVKTAEALQQAAAAPVLSVVPRARQRTPLVAWAEAAEDLTRRSKSYSARREAFRHLRTNLQFVDVERPAKLIVITSPELGEGKSTTAANLAITFAEAGRRVALIEADLRRPRLAEYLRLEAGQGLSNVLSEHVRVEDVLQRWGPNELYVLPSASIPLNPSELLASPGMVTLLERFRESFDVVIVDTPPVLPFTDAAVVAAIADGVVLVVRSGKTHEERIRRAVASLRGVDARLLGCVLSMQSEPAGAGYYDYGYRYRDHDRGSRSVVVAQPTAAHAGTEVASAS